MEEVKHNIDYKIKASNAIIEVDVSAVSKINFSRKNIKSILYNLMSNAIKYRSPDRTPEVTVKIEKIDGKVSLSVKDNGLGLAADKKDKVFAMFKRFHDHVEGSGVGLYIVKRIIDYSKGKIEVDSTLGEGTNYTITIQ